MSIDSHPNASLKPPIHSISHDFSSASAQNFMRDGISRRDVRIRKDQGTLPESTVWKVCCETGKRKDRNQPVAGPKISRTLKGSACKPEYRRPNVFNTSKGSLMELEWRNFKPKQMGRKRKGKPVREEKVLIQKAQGASRAQL